tara:strand:- start:3770 stop:4285 length:516 start_codon:yes stop_codon:yes gene_type:complete
MITLKENQLNTIAFQKETDTPLVTSSLDSGSVYNIITYPTLQNNTALAGITYTTDVEPTNPRWTTLKTNIASSSNYTNNQIEGDGGTTYNLEIWYGPIVPNTQLIWGTTETTWLQTTQTWSSIGGNVNYNTVTANSTLKYTDRIFVSGTVQPNQETYISSNEDATYIVYTG